MIEEITYRRQLLALVVRSNYNQNGIKFFSQPKHSQQLAYMKRPAGYRIQPHIHLYNRRFVEYTQEVLFVKKGIIIVQIYNDKKKLVKDVMLTTGDIIHLISGGHGIFFQVESEVFEVKQGSYTKSKDKERF